MKVGISAAGVVRTNFAMPHMLGAARFSRMVADVEELHKGQVFGEFYEEILAYSMACIFSAVASVEAYINEFFIDHDKYLVGVSESLIQKLWEIYEKKSILEKYELATLLKNDSRFDSSSTEFQNINILIKLRNALVHFKPEWEDEQVGHKKLSAQLKGKFTPSPFINGNEPIFPKAWATAECCHWAVGSSLSFIQLFETELGLDHKFEKFNGKLSLGN